MNDHAQRGALDGDLSGSAADVFAIGVEVERMFGLDTETGGGEVIDFADAQMASEINRGEHAGQLEGIDAADYADVEEAVVHLGAGGDLHPSAVGGSVGEGGQEGRLGFFYFPFNFQRVRRNTRSLHCASHSLRGWEAPVGMTGLGGGGHGWSENFHGKRRELEHGRGESEGVAAMSAEPARQVVGAASNFGVEADSGYGAEA